MAVLEEFGTALLYFWLIFLTLSSVLIISLVGTILSYYFKKDELFYGFRLSLYINIIIAIAAYLLAHFL